MRSIGNGSPVGHRLAAHWNAPNIFDLCSGLRVSARGLPAPVTSHWIEYKLPFDYSMYMQFYGGVVFFIEKIVFCECVMCISVYTIYKGTL